MNEPISRRSMIRHGLLAGVGSGFLAEFVRADAPRAPTPHEIQGPFYPLVAQKDVDFDLTRVEGREGRAQGRVIHLHGKVLDTTGKVVPDATVELWQANTHGRYNHPHDPNPAPLDPDFQGWAIVPSGERGEFHFKTIYPGPYPVTPQWSRPPHIHYKVAKRGYIELITQMYFPGEALNDEDRLLLRKRPEERPRMIARPDPERKDHFGFDLVIEEA